MFSSMKKIILCCILSSLVAINTNAQTVELFDENALDNATKTETNQLETVQHLEETSQNNKNEEDKDGLLSFITKPLSLFFSADDKIKTPDGKEETFLEKATRQALEGKLEDQMNLAYMYLYGTNGVQQDFNKAFEYYQMAAKQNDPIALNNLGSLYFNGIGVEKDNKTALALFKKAADLGNDNAATNLAFIYLKGGVKDPVRNKIAMDLFKKAAQSGNNVAKFMLGYAYYIGFVYQQNFDQAFNLVKSAANGDSNIDEAQIVLAEMYLNGKGTVQNYTKGIVAYRAAVNQGNSEAYMKLAKIYQEGKITPQNLIMAHSLYNIASVQEETGAAKKRDKIGEKLNLEELLKAQADAQNFQPQPSELTKYIRKTFGFDIRSYIDMNVITTQGNK